MKRLILAPAIALCAIFGQTAAAQDYMPILLEFHPGANLSDAQPGTIPGNMQVSFYKIGLGYGVPFDVGTGRLILGARYETLHIDLVDSDSFVFFSPDNLHYARLEMAWTQPLGNDWGLMASMAPGFASDFKELGADDFRFLGGALLTKRANTSLSYGFGAAYTSDFGAPLVVPLAMVDWKNERGLNFNATLPLRAEMTYQLNARNEIGLKAGISGTQYNINLDPTEFDIIDNSEKIDLPAKYSVITVGPMFRQRISGPFYVTVEAGVSIRRQFKFDGEVVDGTLDQDPSFFLRTGLAVRP